jgi:SWI/SNF-related matrix-associated actin-dependent regulator of chromatin subfamily A3
MVCRSEDQQKVRRAIARQFVDPADVPATAKVAAPLAVVSGAPSDALAGQKRKYNSDVAETSRSLSQLSIPNAHSAKGSGGLPEDDDDEFGLIEPEPADELYCVTNSSIVGVQYYKGMCFGVSCQVSLCLPGVQVLLGLENKSAWSGSRRTDMTGTI